MPDDRDEEQKETYHKVDRRVGHHAEEGGTDPAPAEEPEAAEPEAEQPAPEATEGAAEEAIQIDMYGILRMMFGMCVEQAWVHLGLHLPPGGKETKTDLAQARMAIDTIAFIKGALGDNLSADEQREVEQVLATLRMNFIQRT
jgi:hypothetical protein